MELASLWQQQTTQARQLLDSNLEVNLTGLEDIRPECDLARHGSTLMAADLVRIKASLVLARTVLRTFEKLDERFSALTGIVAGLETPSGIVDAISSCINDHGDILDNASPRLEDTRRELKLSHEKLMGKLERILNDSRYAPMLQENLITRRDDRYVIPLRSEFKGQLKAIVHDQSSSGATLFVEPLAVVDLNNRYKELQLAERDEERRILADLSARIGQQAECIAVLVEALARLDVIFARAKYANALGACEPILRRIDSPADTAYPGTVIKLYSARHPLLSPESVVPIDLVLKPETYALIITGPNTGGKTVTLKTLGILALMAQSGLHIPARSGSEISVFDYIFADIGDEQSIEQSLSTFSGHITQIIRILQKADRNSLVLLDELGAGTDPQEGAALAMAIVQDMLDRKITCMVATHYPELKVFAQNTRGVMNASLEFDLQTLKPTYHLTLGLPGRSNALAIAEKLGLPERIIQQARSSVRSDDLQADNLLDEIYDQRKQARETREQADLALREVSRLERELNLQLAQIENERTKILEQARLEAAEEAENLQAEFNEVRRELSRARQPLNDLQNARELLDTAADKMDRIQPTQTASVGRIPGSLNVGAKVRVISLGTEGVVKALSENDAEVQVGQLRMRARLEDLRLPGEESPPVHKTVSTLHRKTGPARPTNPVTGNTRGMELDIRGQRAEDALEILDRYLDSAYASGFPFVRIIHGKGTGRLRQVIREALQASPLVQRFETGMENEGGDGVTVAFIRPD